MNEAVPADDHLPDDDAGQEDGAEPDEPDDDEDDTELRWARLRLDRLDMALGFVNTTVPPYGVAIDGIGAAASDAVPPSIDLCRRRALVAAFALIEREFSPPMGGETDGDA